MIIQHIKLHMYTDYVFPMIFQIISIISQKYSKVYPQTTSSIPIPQVMCHHCGRYFNPEAAERHIPICANVPWHRVARGGHILWEFATELWKMDHLYPFVVFFSIETGDFWDCSIEDGDFR